MNIAHLLPRSAHFPLKKHNGRYDWVLRLATMQAAKGHTVTIYAAPNSSEETGTINWRSSAYDFGDKTTNNLALLKEAFQQDEHDIYHSHFDYLHYFAADETTKPVLFTEHWFPEEIVGEAFRYNTTNKALAIPVTHFMLEKNKELGITTHKTIYHGIDLDLFKPDSSPQEDRLVFVGRITPRKGVLEAINLAKESGQNLDIVGKVNEADAGYWEKLRPLIDGEQIRYHGTLPQKDIAHLFSRSKAFLFPSQTPEAFGQVTIEAQACGLPVIVTNDGTSKELIQQGTTGFAAATKTEFLDAINKVGSLDRQACRLFAEHFDIHRMVNEYDALYASLIK